MLNIFYGVYLQPPPVPARRYRVALEEQQGEIIHAADELVYTLYESTPMVCIAHLMFCRNTMLQILTNITLEITFIGILAQQCCDSDPQTGIETCIQTQTVTYISIIT